LPGKLVRLAFLIVGLIPFSAEGADSWTRVRLSPLGLSADIRAVAIDPVDPETLYVGLLAGGVYKSTDGAKSWRDANNAPSGLITTVALAIDPTARSTVFAATLNDGVFKTTNGGASWTPAKQGLGEVWVTAVAVEPRVTRARPAVYVGTSGGVFKSSDGGKSWAGSSNGVKLTGRGLGVVALAIDAAMPTTVYAGSPEGVFKTTDGGRTWIERNTGLFPLAPAVHSLAVGPDSRSVYAGAGDGVYKSTDGGAAWRSLSEEASLRDVHVLAVQATRPQILYAGTPRGLQKSSDGGRSWSAISLGSPEPEVHALAIDPSDNVVYAGTTAGLFRGPAPGR
jgi:photosystem II stability/assembly factor-like uncharacterized protein